MANGYIDIDGIGARAPSDAERLAVAYVLGHVTVDMFGAVGDANHFDVDTLSWYSNAGKTVPATDDSSAFQTALDWATPRGLEVVYTKRHLIGPTVNVGKGRLRAAFPGQMNLAAGPALCASHAYTSVRQADNTWSNPVLRIDNSDDFIGGGQLTNVTILGSNQNRQDHLYRCPRTAIQGYFWINGHASNCLVANFTKSGFSAVGLVQDKDLPGWWFANCGTNTDPGSGGEYVAAFETRPSTMDHGSFAAGRAPNALHWSGARFEGCPAIIDINQGSRNVAEIEFLKSKIEVGTWQTFWSSPVRVNTGSGAVSFVGTHFTLPVMNRPTSGAKVWAILVQNYQTAFVGCVFRGAVKVLQATGTNIRIKGCQHEGAPTNFVGMDIAAGEVDLLLTQNMASAAGTRYGIKIGRGVKTNLKFGTLVNSASSTTQDVTSGRLVEHPVLTSSAGGRPRISIHVADDGSAFRQVFQYYQDDTGSDTLAASSELDIAKITGPNRQDITEIPSGILDMSQLGEDYFDINGSALTLSRLNRASIGRPIRFRAKQAFTLTHGPYVKAKGATSRTVAADELVILLPIGGGVAVEV